MGKSEVVPCLVDGCVQPKNVQGYCQKHIRRLRLYGDVNGKADTKNENSTKWKGDDVGYGALHSWVKRRLQPPDKCPTCDRAVPLDLANISQEYKRDLDDWEWLCRKCHMQQDGRGRSISNALKGRIFSSTHRTRLGESNRRRRGKIFRTEMTDLEQLLSEGLNTRQIALRYQCDWHTVRRRIEHLAEEKRTNL